MSGRPIAELYQPYADGVKDEKRIKQIFSFNQPEENFVMAINFWKEGEKEDLPKLFLIHGFGASGMTYYRVCA